MATLGMAGLLIAFVAEVVSLLFLLIGHILVHRGARNAGAQSAGAQRNARSNLGESLAWGGAVATIVSTVMLTFCCGLLVFCFMSGDTSLQYVVENRSDETGVLGWLYRLSGLWAGREGSLLFWAWLISLFNLVVAVRCLRKSGALDRGALFIAQLVLTAFTGILLFSESNVPFVAMDASYFNAAGELTNGAEAWGMNSLLEHWAMAVHPPALFIGYAGLTIPFAYALSALVVNDSSSQWVERSSRITIFSWLFLGLGIVLGAAWAYSVLGWGGYWGWDAVENASLLPWLAGLALIHSFTAYRRRGILKRWSVMCACLAFAFAITGTFITRSGIVESVHTFAAGDVSTVVFLTLIVVAIVAGIVGLLVRRKSFGLANEGQDDFSSMASRDVAYYFNNVILIVVAVLLLYMTVSSALPSWLPFGGQTISTRTYESIARPLGIIYCALVAVGPLLSWGKTDGHLFWRRARVPALCALVLFVALMVYFFVYLVPTYDGLIAAGGSMAASVFDYGPAWYYFALTIVGFAVASLLFFNALFMLVRTLRGAGKRLWHHLSTVGGSIVHLSMAVILVGLIGSSMYMTEKGAYLAYDESVDGTTEEFVIQDFTLKYTSNSVGYADNGVDILYTVEFDVYEGDDFVGHVAPAIELNTTTFSQNAIASVLSFPDKDLFVVYRGVNDAGDFAIDVRINPCILFVWIGAGLMMVGTVISCLGRRETRDIKGSDYEQ